MGYRGSKSEFHNPQPFEISVKEQRVDGSYFGITSKSISRLRYTLMGKEICYQTKIPSKQIIRPAFLGSLWLGIAAKNFSTNSQCKNLIPFYVLCAAAGWPYTAAAAAARLGLACCLLLAACCWLHQAYSASCCTAAYSPESKGH